MSGMVVFFFTHTVTLLPKRRRHCAVTQFKLLLPLGMCACVALVEEAQIIYLRTTIDYSVQLIAA